jgi:hypothetical protein
MVERLTPTPEDSEIFVRNMRRIFRWNAETPCADPFGRDLRAIHNACADYMEFTPPEQD